MRILHVADLHLGRSLGDLSREAEQRAVVAEMIDAANAYDVALTVIAGDVYDTFSPPAWAEDLFYELLDGLAAGGRRGVAVIAGNHDSGLRVAAAEPLARRLGIILAGDVGEPLRGHERSASEVRVVSVAPQVVRVEVPGAEAPIIAGLLPFLSEAKVARDAPSESLGAEPDGVLRYADRLAAELVARAAFADPRAVNLLASHQYVTGGTPSESERRLRIGGISDIDGSAIPPGVDYVALGHLHRPQEIVGARSLAAYSGSPIAYSFSEAGQDKRAVLVHLSPGRPARMQDVPLRGGRPLEIWPITTIEEAMDRAAKIRDRSPIVEVRANLGRLLTRAESEALFALPNVTMLGVRDLGGPTNVDAARPLVDDGREIEVEDLFGELWQRRHGGLPDDATVAELRSLLDELGNGETPVPPSVVASGVSSGVASQVVTGPAPRGPRPA